MNLIDKLFPIITLLVGWGLSEIGKFSTNRKNDRRKLKKLLFNLLELRWLLKREFDLNIEITNYIEKLKAKLIDVFGQGAAEGADLVKPMITAVLKDKLVDSNRIKEIESNIDLTINELSEIHPVFAYELSGRYKIKEILESADSYFKEISQLTESIPEELTNWIQPRLSRELLIELDSHIIEIAKQVNWKTKNIVEKKLFLKKVSSDDEIDGLIDEYIEKIKTMANASTPDGE